MATLTAEVIPYLIIPPNTGWVDLEVDKSILINSPCTVTLEVTVGSFQFSRDKSGSDSLSPTYTTTINKCVLTLTNSNKLYFKAASTSDRAFLSE